MRQGRSTGRPTKQEADWIVACKEGPCVACVVKFGGEEKSWVWRGCDFHHFKSGNLRRGHMFGVGLCPWHHRQIPPRGHTVPQARAFWGPSLMDGGKTFAAAYGTDDELLARQKRLLGEE